MVKRREKPTLQVVSRMIDCVALLEDMKWSVHAVARRLLHAVARRPRAHITCMMCLYLLTQQHSMVATARPQCTGQTPQPQQQ